MSNYNLMPLTNYTKRRRCSFSQPRKFREFTSVAYCRWHKNRQVVHNSLCTSPISHSAPLCNRNMHTCPLHREVCEIGLYQRHERHEHVNYVITNTVITYRNNALIQQLYCYHKSCGIWPSHVSRWFDNPKLFDVSHPASLSCFFIMMEGFLIFGSWQGSNDVANL